jgi:crotonobetainyl-CoA:carnitine CoA-transferase CaiB-like acyl-CoA transferase
VPDPSLGGEAVPMPGVIPKLSETPGRVRVGAPLLGADNDTVFQKLRSPAELAEPRSAGTI